MTYGVASGILLFCADNLAGALGGVEGRLALDHGLTRRTAATADVLADLDLAGIEISHLEGFGDGVSVWCDWVLTFVAVAAGLL